MTEVIRVLRPPKAPDWWEPTAKTIDFWLRRLGKTDGQGSTVTSATTLGPAGAAYFVNASGGAVVISLPPAASASGRYDVKKIDASANTVTIDPAGSETIDGGATLVISTQYQNRTFQSDGANWWVL